MALITNDPIFILSVDGITSGVSYNQAMDNDAKTTFWQALIEAAIRHDPSLRAEETVVRAEAAHYFARRAFGLCSRQAIMTMALLADTYAEAGRFTDAETIYREMVALLEMRLGKQDLTVAIGLHGLAETYSDDGKFQEAREARCKSLKIFERHKRAS